MTAHNPAQDAFDTWKRALDEGTQAWLKVLGQPPAGGAATPGAPDFSQFWRPILTQGLDAWQKAAAQGGVSPDFARQWKAFVDQWVDGCSKALSQAMATEGFAQALGRYLDQMLAAQAPLRQGMEQYTDQALRTLGLPSRQQVVGLASQIVSLDERIEGIEERLDELRDLLRHAAPSPTPAGKAGPAPAGAAARRRPAGGPGGTERTRPGRPKEAS